MKEKYDEKSLPADSGKDKAIIELPGYPLYPEGEDIFNKYQQEQDLNPEDISETKTLNAEVRSGSHNKLNETVYASGNDLDVPGSELDDALEEVGSEDEENNYYSLGGDDHNDLDENK